MLKECKGIKNMLNENRKDGSRYLELLKSENDDINISIIKDGDSYYFQCTLTDVNGKSAFIFKELLFENQINDLLSLEFNEE